jgi:hypothetical protein
MHRKSLEAADKLKDCDQSDGESRDQSERSNSSPSLVPTKRSSNEPQSGCNEKIVSLSPPITTSTAIYNSVLSNNGKCNIKEELRTSSIAALRAKALEHCAKVNQIANKSNENAVLFPTNRSTPHSPTNLPTTHYNHSSTRHHVY